MCTHLLLEAEGLADEIVVMQAGTSLESGKPADLARMYFPGESVRISSTIPESLDVLESQPGVLSYERSGDVAKVDIRSNDVIPGLVATLSERNTPITSVVPVESSLEDLYFAIRREHGSVEGELAPPGGSSGRSARNESDGGHGTGARAA